METTRIDFSPMLKKQATPKVGVGVVIRKDGKILMGERTGSHGANKWSLPGGHVDLGEDPSYTCIREVFEETGIHIEDAIKATFSHTVFEEEGLHYVTLFYEAEWDMKQEPVNKEKERQRNGRGLTRLIYQRTFLALFLNPISSKYFKIQKDVLVTLRTLKILRTIPVLNVGQMIRPFTIDPAERKLIDYRF